MSLRANILALASGALESAHTESCELVIYGALADVAEATKDSECAQIAAMCRAAAQSLRESAARRQEFRDLIQGQLQLSPAIPPHPQP